MSKFKASPPEKAYYLMEVEADKPYFLCSCGKSANKPFCDGSHSGSEYQPVKYKSDTVKDVYFCGCGKSKNQPICDGTHKE